VQWVDEVRSPNMHEKMGDKAVLKLKESFGWVLDLQMPDTIQVEKIQILRVHVCQSQGYPSMQLFGINHLTHPADRSGRTT